MAQRRLSDVVYLTRSGEPLPLGIQELLHRQDARLARDFPRITDPAVIQNILDAVGQRVEQKRARGENIENIETFIHVATANAAISFLRSADALVHGIRVQTDVEELPAEPPPSVELWWTVSQILPQDEADVLVRHLFGDKHREIAEALGLPSSTVRNRYVRALDRLRQVLLGAEPKRVGAASLAGFDFNRFQ